MTCNCKQHKLRLKKILFGDLFFVTIAILKNILLASKFKAHILQWNSSLNNVFYLLIQAFLKLQFLLRIFCYFHTDEKTKPSRDGKAQPVKDADGNIKHSLARETASVILAVAFNTTSIRFITRAQLVLASKTLQLNIKPSLSKEEFILPVAKALISKGFLRIESSSERVTRENVFKLKPF